LKIGICDDNDLYLKHLNQVVCNLFFYEKDIEIEALNPNELSLHIATKTCSYDILITDIDMGSFNGIDFAKEINQINPSCIIIFISSYLNYATEVYDVGHIYFVLKAEAETRLPKALEKAYSVYHERKVHYLTFHYQNIEYRIAQNDITHIEALGRYLYIFVGNQSYKCINSLKAVSGLLTNTFIRCHNSFIVNAYYIRSISRTNCVLSTGVTIPISQTYSKEFQSLYTSYVSSRLI
jgi:DNA-binding LytR/AlgR family response regulator